jgi:hypothetical protein
VWANERMNAARGERMKKLAKGQFNGYSSTMLLVGRVDGLDELAHGRLFKVHGSTRAASRCSGDWSLRRREALHRAKNQSSLSTGREQKMK